MYIGVCSKQDERCKRVRGNVNELGGEGAGVQSGHGEQNILLLNSITD